MNYSNESNSTYSETFATIITDYLIPSISTVGTLFNAFSLIVLNHKNLSTIRFYHFLRCRTFCNLVVCFFGVFYKKVACKEVCHFNYESLYLTWFVIILPTRIAFSASVHADILLILNRLTLLSESKQTIFYSISKKAYFLNNFPI